MDVKQDDRTDVRLLLIISIMDINWNQVAARWAQVYGDQPGVPQPTQKAITEHVAKLRKKLDSSGGSATRATAGPSAAASSSKTSPTKTSKNTPTSNDKAKGKGKQKIVDPDSHSDDSEMNSGYGDVGFKKEDKEDDKKPSIFGEITRRTRESLPRFARPRPGRFMEDKAELDPHFILTDIEESDAEDDTTVQNTPTGTPTPAPKSLPAPFPDFDPADPKNRRPTEAEYRAVETGPASFAEAHKAIKDFVKRISSPATVHTPSATPTSTPSLRKRVDDEDEDDCIIVGPKKKARRAE